MSGHWQSKLEERNGELKPVLHYVDYTNDNYDERYEHELDREIRQAKNVDREKRHETHA